MSPNYVMNTKAGDYRILIANEEILANPDYIPITEKEFQAMTKGHVTGPKILQNRFLQERIEQAKAAGLVEGDAPPVNTEDPVDAKSFMNGKSSNDLKAIGDSARNGDEDRREDERRAGEGCWAGYGNRRASGQ